MAKPKGKYSAAALKKLSISGYDMGKTGPDESNGFKDIK
jgi:hypothetical protein